MRDLSRPLPDGAHLAILTQKSGPKALQLIRHDAAHVLAAAVMELYEGVKISIGPPIEDGFYYDFEFPDGVALSEADFPKIEERMRAHVKAAETFERQDVSVGAGARALPRRAPGLQGRADRRPRHAPHARACTASRCSTVSLYTNGPFTDLCRGPHAPSTKTVGAFKLSSLAGAYWRGDSNRTMLTRIYGTAFFTKAELDEHLERIEQAKARDHRKLGRELGLFSFSEVSPGAAFWTRRGHQRLQLARRASRARWAPSAATARSRPHRSSTPSCGRPPGTGASTARTCSRVEVEEPRDGASSR